MNQLVDSFCNLSEPKSHKKILEVIRDDNTISSDLKEVLQKWYKDFADNFSGLKNNPDLAFDD